MSRPFSTLASTLACAAAGLALCAPLVGWAQAGTAATTAAKKPAAGKSATKTISGAAAKGKLLTYKELEVCLKEQDALKLRPPELQRRRDTMEQERVAIQKDTDALKTDSTALAQLSERVKDFNARMKAQGEKVKSWRERDEEFAKANRTGTSADRQRKELEREREELQKSETALDAEGKTLGEERDKRAAGFNDRAVAQEKAASDWNARSRKLDEDFRAYEDDRKDWHARCAERSYREEDEKLIRSGK